MPQTTAELGPEGPRSRLSTCKYDKHLLDEVHRGPYLISLGEETLREKKGEGVLG